MAYMRLGVFRMSDCKDRTWKFYEIRYGLQRSGLNSVPFSVLVSNTAHLLEVLCYGICIFLSN